MTIEELKVMTHEQFMALYEEITERSGLSFKPETIQWLQKERLSFMDTWERTCNPFQLIQLLKLVESPNRDIYITISVTEGILKQIFRSNRPLFDAMYVLYIHLIAPQKNSLQVLAKARAEICESMHYIRLRYSQEETISLLWQAIERICEYTWQELHYAKEDRKSAEKKMYKIRYDIHSNARSTAFELTNIMEAKYKKRTGLSEIAEGMKRRIDEAGEMAQSIAECEGYVHECKAYADYNDACAAYNDAEEKVNSLQYIIKSIIRRPASECRAASE